MIKGRQIDGQMAGGVYGHVGEYRDCCLLCPKKTQCPSREESDWETLNSATYQMEQSLFIRLEQEKSNMPTACVGVLGLFQQGVHLKKDQYNRARTVLLKTAACIDLADLYCGTVPSDI